MLRLCFGFTLPLYNFFFFIIAWGVSSDSTLNIFNLPLLSLKFWGAPLMIFKRLIKVEDFLLFCYFYLLSLLFLNCRN